jgi:excisionase family DNA binding protein
METNINSGKKLLSIGESAKYLGVSIDTLRRWEVRGRITPFRSPGGHRYYVEEDLDRLFNKRYTRDEFSKAPKKEALTEEAPEAKVEEPQITNPETSDLDYSIQSAPSTFDAANLQPDVERHNKEQIKEIEAEEPAEATEGSEPSLENISKSILEPTSTTQNQVVATTSYPAINSDNQPKNTLNDILGDKKQAKLTKSELVLIIGVILFVAIDVILFLRWYSSTNIVVPIP